MSRFRFVFVVAAVMYGSFGSFDGLARADEPVGAADRSAQVIVTDPNYQQQPQQQQVQVVEEESPARQGRGLEYGGSIFVPIWLGDTSNSFSPGIGIDLRAGWELGSGLSIDGHLGFTYNGVRGSAVTSDSLQGAYLGVGLRYAFLGRSAIVPFLQAGLQLNLWSYCYDVGSTCKSSFDTVNLGLYGGGGLVYEVSPNLSVDFGLNFMMVLGSDDYLFEGFEKNLQPFIGVTLYY